MPTPNAWIKMPLMKSGSGAVPPPPIADSGMTTRFMKKYREHAEDRAANNRMRLQDADLPAGEVVGGDDAEGDEVVNEKAEERRRQARRMRGSEQPARDALKNAHRRGAAKPEDHDRVDTIDRPDHKRAIQDRARSAQLWCPHAVTLA